MSKDELSNEEREALERGLASLRAAGPAEPTPGLAERAFRASQAQPSASDWLDGFVHVGWRAAVAGALAVGVSWAAVLLFDPGDSADSGEIVAAAWLEDGP